MPTWKKLLLGAATAWPAVYLLGFVGFFAVVVAQALTSSAPAWLRTKGAPPAFLLPLFALHLFTGLWLIALTSIYVVHAYRSKRIPEDRRLIWILLLIFGSFIAQGVYWFLYVWPEAPPERPQHPS